jgi:hypothetical protein
MHLRSISIYVLEDIGIKEGEFVVVMVAKVGEVAESLTPFRIHIFPRRDVEYHKISHFQ